MTIEFGRRNFMGVVAAGLATSACTSLPFSMAGAKAVPMDAASFHANRRFAKTSLGDVAYVEQGAGPVALFIHGVPLNGLHWRFVMAEMAATHRCIALDLMGLGYTKIDPKQDVSFNAQAEMIRRFLDAMGIDKVDLVTNDSGGAIGQIFAVNNPARLRSLTLSNCDVHDNWPPVQIAAAMEAARAGTLIDRYAEMIADAQARYTRWGRAYADSRVLTDDVYSAYIEPLRATPETRANFHRYWTSFDNRQTVSIEGKLRELRVPTLVIWALEDIFFDVKWAHWLARTIPGVQRVVEVPGARLFFPEDRPQAMIEPLKAFLRPA